VSQSGIVCFGELTMMLFRSLNDQWKLSQAPWRRKENHRERILCPSSTSQRSKDHSWTVESDTVSVAKQQHTRRSISLAPVDDDEEDHKKHHAHRSREFRPLSDPTRVQYSFFNQRKPADMHKALNMITKRPGQTISTRDRLDLSR
jgi:hypothetical protein